MGNACVSETQEFNKGRPPPSEEESEQPEVKTRQEILDTYPYTDTSDENITKFLKSLSIADFRIISEMPKKELYMHEFTHDNHKFVLCPYRRSNMFIVKYVYTIKNGTAVKPRQLYEREFGYEYVVGAPDKMRLTTIFITSGEKKGNYIPINNQSESICWNAPYEVNLDIYSIKPVAPPQYEQKN